MKKKNRLLRKIRQNKTWLVCCYLDRKYGKGFYKTVTVRNSLGKIPSAEKLIEVVKLHFHDTIMRKGVTNCTIISVNLLG